MAAGTPIDTTRNAHRRSTSGRGPAQTARWPRIGAVLVVFLALDVAGVVGAVMVTVCGPGGGPVWAPVAAGVAAFVSGCAVASVHWHAWAQARVDRALRDPLTGLPTRTVIEDKLDVATRTGAAVTVALADVDGLHAINANFGHAAGDQYLAAVAHRLARAMPAGGCLVRQGGDEFTMLVPGTDTDGLATAIGSAMAGPALIAGNRIQPRASIGIASNSTASNGIATSGGRRNGDAHQARARADIAMFAAKTAGGNHIRIWDPDRHDEPATDGTRPARRRRDIDRRPAPGIPWQSRTTDDDLIPLLLPPAEARLIHQALVRARDARVDPDVNNPRSGFARLAARLGPLLDPEPLDPEPLDPEPLDPEPLDPEPLDPEPLDPEPLDPEPLDRDQSVPDATGDAE